MPSHTNRKHPLVLHVRGVTGAGGGPEKTILNSPRFLRSLGYESVCAYMHPPRDPGWESIQTRAVEANAQVVSIIDRGPWDWRVLKDLIRYCRQHRVAIWHGHDYKSNALGLIVRRFWPMKLVTTVHGWVQHTRRTSLYYKIDQLSLRRYEQVICVSQDLYDTCGNLGVPEARRHLIHNGIDAEEFRRSQPVGDARDRFDFPAGAAVIGAMGRLSPEKGFDLLIRAAARLQDAGHDVHVWIAGEGAARADLETLIAELGRQESIRLLGHVEDTKSFFEALDVFALSSLREGLPNVLLEAMALEAPVMATRINGIPALIRDGENGLLVEPGSVDTLAAGLRQLLFDEQLRHRLADAARQTIEQSFSFQERMEKIAKIYDGLLSSQPEPAVADTVSA